MAVGLVEIWRGDRVESVHAGHVAVWGPGGLEEAWGDPGAVIFPRSSCKMVQALPLAASGEPSLTPERLALACASHGGAAMHTERVAGWLSDLGLAEPDLRCGAHLPSDRAAAEAMIRAGESPCQLHNNCSGKHAGFLALGRRLGPGFGGGPDYIDIDHPVQRAAREAFEEATGEPSPGWGIDGCSAPNFLSTVAGLARAAAGFAAPDGTAGGRARRALVEAMIAHPELVAGENRACTNLMRAARGRAAVKTGAEGVFLAILPERGVGIALKVADGAMRAAEAAVAALLVRHGALDADDPVARRLAHGESRNWRGLVTGRTRALIGPR